MNVDEFMKKLSDTLQGLPAPLVIAKLFNIISTLARHVDDPKILDKIIDELSTDTDIVGDEEPFDDFDEDLDDDYEYHIY